MRCGCTPGRRQVPFYISHSIASSQLANALIWKPRFSAQSAKNAARSNFSTGQRTAIFREKALRKSVSSAARYQRSVADISIWAFRVSRIISKSPKELEADAISAIPLLDFSKSNCPSGVALMKSCAWIILTLVDMVASCNRLLRRNCVVALDSSLYQFLVYGTQQVVERVGCMGMSLNGPKTKVFWPPKFW